MGIEGKIFDALVDLYVPLITLIFANPQDLINLDMRNYNGDIWFLSDVHVEKGTMYVVKDVDLKRQGLSFCLQHPDRMWKGEKDGADKKCKTCCEYDSPKGSKTGYCCQARTHFKTGVVPEDWCCEYYIRGAFKDRIELRKLHRK